MAKLSSTGLSKLYFQDKPKWYQWSKWTRKHIIMWNDLPLYRIWPEIYDLVYIFIASCHAFLHVFSIQCGYKMFDYNYIRILFSDHNLNSTNATVSVACHAENAETSTVSILSPLSSETSTISSVTTSFTKERQSTDAVHSLHSPTSSKETSTLTVGYTRKAPPQIGEDESRDSEQIGKVYFDYYWIGKIAEVCT